MNNASFQLDSQAALARQPLESHIRLEAWEASWELAHKGACTW